MARMASRAERRGCTLLIALVCSQVCPTSRKLALIEPIGLSRLTWMFRRAYLVPLYSTVEPLGTSCLTISSHLRSGNPSDDRCEHLTVAPCRPRLYSEASRCFSLWDSAPLQAGRCKRGTPRLLPARRLRLRSTG